MGKTCHLNREIFLVEDSIFVVSTKCDLGGSYKTGICAFDCVDVGFSSSWIEADSIENLFLCHVRCNERSETMFYNDIHGIALQSHLKDYSLVLDIVELLA